MLQNLLFLCERHTIRKLQSSLTKSIPIHQYKFNFILVIWLVIVFFLCILSRISHSNIFKEREGICFPALNRIYKATEDQNKQLFKN